MLDVKLQVAFEQIQVNRHDQGFWDCSAPIGKTSMRCMKLSVGLNIDFIVLSDLQRHHASYNSSPSANRMDSITHLVIPLWTPALQALIPFRLLIRLLFPTLGNPEGTAEGISASSNRQRAFILFRINP